MLPFQSVRSGCVALILALSLAGCGAAAAPTPTMEPATPVKFQMSWIHEYSAAGFYEAELNNHFAEQNLTVTLEEGGFIDGQYIEPIDKVVSGEVDFGLSSAAAILQARADGKPVVAIAAVLQRNPTALIFLDSSIQQPKDLIGKTITVSDGGARQVLDVMLASQGIEPGDVTIVPRTDFGVDPLLNGDVDVLVGWVINEGVAVKEAGKEPHFMLLNDYGIPDYVTLIFTSESMIKDHPELVERFLRGVVAGSEDMVKDPEAATTAVLKYNSALNHDEQLARLQASLPLLQPARAKIGLMDAATWNTIYNVLRDAGVITADVDVSKAFTTTFLDKIYAQ